MIRQALAHLLDAIADRLDPDTDEPENDDGDIVATGHYATQLSKGGMVAHFVSFVRHEDGTRSTTIDTSHPQYGSEHYQLLFDRMDWRVHGAIPTTARIVEPKPTGKLILLAGGKAGPNDPPDGAA